jgi:hypothetical protein
MEMTKIPVALGAMVQVGLQAIVALPLFPQLIILCIRDPGNFMLHFKMPGYLLQAESSIPLPQRHKTTMAASRLIAPHLLMIPHCLFRKNQG